MVLATQTFISYLAAIFGCFQKYGYPQIINSNRVFPYTPSILRYHYFCILKKELEKSHSDGDRIAEVVFNKSPGDAC